MKKMHGGFTLIELIIVISILSIIAVVALPRYVDLQTQAAVAQADGVYGAAQAAAAINFAAGRAGAAQPAGGAISTGADLLSALDGTPEGWSASGNTITATINAVAYTITVSTAETSTAKAVLTKSW